MKKLWLGIASVFALIVGGSIAYSYGNTQMTWHFNNAEINDVQIEFSTTDHIWPGDNKAYSLPALTQKYLTINCFTGEYICYGGWVNGDANRYWGMGFSRSQSCSNCCYVCGQSNPNIRLTP